MLLSQACGPGDKDLRLVGEVDGVTKISYNLCSARLTGKVYHKKSTPSRDFVSHNIALHFITRHASIGHLRERKERQGGGRGKRERERERKRERERETERQREQNRILQCWKTTVLSTCSPQYPFRQLFPHPTPFLRSHCGDIPQVPPTALQLPYSA